MTIARALFVNRGLFCRNSARSCRMEKQVRVHDSNADLRYLVLPKRPAGTEDWTADQLEALVTRDSMIGVSDVRRPEEAAA